MFSKIVYSEFKGNNKSPYMTKKAQMEKNNTSGFTLIELSIVLVIIGLIVGAIIIGQDIISAARVRGTVAQAEKYNSAVNTFRTKYQGIPGDLLTTYASAFGVFTLTIASAGTAGEGDGNGLIEGGAAAATVPSGETIVFWRHMTDAGYVDGSFGTVGNALLIASTGLVTANNSNVQSSLPPAKLSPTQYFTVYANLGLNYFQLLPVAQVQTPAAYTFAAFGITPVQAYDIDNKIDDGKPNTGIITAAGIAAVNAVPSWAAAATVNDCMSGGASNVDPTDIYNGVPGSGGDSTSCSLKLRFN